MNPPIRQAGNPASVPHAVEASELLRLFGVDPARGLSASQVDELRQKYGRNQLAEAPGVPTWRKLLRQFQELVIWILIAAAVISGALGEWTDTAAIVAIVVVNGLLGFFQEERAERALEALHKMSSPMCKALRDGELRVLAASELVPGDRIELEAGDNIPADARLLEAFGVAVQEAALTGESTPVDKSPSGALAPDTPLGDRRNMAYLGTIVTAGKASAVVAATGMATELGRIAGMLQRYEAERTPLQRRLAELGRYLIGICLALVVVIFALHMLRGGELVETFLLAVSLAVAAVPEGLPAVVTISLALGLQRMVKRNALIRRLPSVETLGSVTVICSDKTGTLTRNEMTVREMVVGQRHFRVTGTGYAPQGQFLPVDAAEASEPTCRQPSQVDPASDLAWCLHIAARCNNAKLSPRQDNADSMDVIGDPTEGALLVAALKAGLDVRLGESRLLYEIPFDSDRKAMSVVLRDARGKNTMYVKGAPEVLLNLSNRERRDGQVVPLTHERRDEIAASGARLAASALRVLAFAYRDDPPQVADEAREENLTFAGLAGMIDPPREEARVAVQRCRDAGIRPVMITGDHPATAAAIAADLHLSQAGDRVVTGAELNELSAEGLADRVESVSVYARVSAEHKLRVVQAWKSRGHVVAMTGDGVNDAPAVKAADIGIAMGVTGTDVTKEASDMVLIDDNFASIVNAVEEGRGIFDNIQKFVHYLLSCNAGEVLLMFFAALVGWPVPLRPVQLLWINLVTDGFPALALAMEKPEPGVMERPPRPPREPVITLPRGLKMLWHGSLIAAAAGLAFWLDYDGEASLPESRTVAFCTIAFAQLFYSFGCRSHRFTLPQLGAFSNPWLIGAIAVSGLLQLAVVAIPALNSTFYVTGFATLPWPMILGLALAPVTIIECLKIAASFWRSLRQKPGQA